MSGATISAVQGSHSIPALAKPKRQPDLQDTVGTFPISKSRQTPPKQPASTSRLGRGLGGLLLLGPIVSIFSALDQPTSMIAVAFRDGFDSSGRVYQEFKRNLYGGWESLITELSGVLVWGFGIAACKMAYDALAPKLSRGKILLPGLETDLLPQTAKAGELQDKPGFFTRVKQSKFVQQARQHFEKLIQVWNWLAELPGLEYILGKIGNAPDAIANRNEAQVLNKAVIEKYFKDASTIEAPSPQKDAQAQTIKAHFLDLVADQGKNQPHLERYLKSNLLKLLTCTTLPVLALGALVPFGLHKLTPWLMSRDKEKQGAKSPTPAPAAPVRNPNAASSSPFTTSPSLLNGKTAIPSVATMPYSRIAAPLPSPVKPVTATPMTTPIPSPATMPHPGLATNIPSSTPTIPGAPTGITPPPPIRFGGGLDGTLSLLLQNNLALTLLGVDIPLSSSRVLMARNKDERNEVLFREIAIIITLFWLQRAIQERVAKFFNRQCGGHSNIDIKVMHQLYEKYAEHPETLQASYNTLQDTLALVAQSHQDIEGERKLVDAIRQYFSEHRDFSQGDNLLFDLAEVSGYIHTQGNSKKYTGSRGERYIDLTRKINTDGVRELADYLATVTSRVAAGAPLSKLLAKHAGLKMSAFALSAAVCWSIVSYLVPKIQHRITYNTRGKDEFPGIQGA